MPSIRIEAQGKDLGGSGFQIAGQYCHTIQVRKGEEEEWWWWWWW